MMDTGGLLISLIKQHQDIGNYTIAQGGLCDVSIH